MFELGVLCVIAIAAIYWATMWLIGRHEDVLYGSFVTPTPGTAGTDTRDAVRELPPELPRRPRTMRRDSTASLPAPMLPTPERRASQPPLQRNTPTADAAPPRTMPPRTAPQRNDVLASLLETIKRDLGEASRR